MATEEEIKRGMGLDEILGSEVPATVYSALQSNVLNRVENSLDAKVPGGVSELLDLFVEADDNDQGLIADAICSALDQLKSDVDEVINGDLAAQAEVRSDQEAVDLTTQILPSEVQTPDLLRLVTTDKFKEIVDFK